MTAPARRPFQLELALAVKDFIDKRLDYDTGREWAFDRCHDLDDGVIKALRAELRDALSANRLPNKFVTKINFIEFDSSNISHACAYYHVTLHATDQEIADLRDYYGLSES